MAPFFWGQGDKRQYVVSSIVKGRGEAKKKHLLHRESWRRRRPC